MVVTFESGGSSGRVDGGIEPGSPSSPEWGDSISENDSMYYRHLLIEFAQNNDSGGVLDILQKGKSIKGLSDTKDEDQEYSVLHHAAFRGHFGICKILINDGCNIIAVDKFKKTAAHLAIQGGYDEIVAYMLERVHPLNFPRQAKLTLVQLASSYGRPNVLNILAARGANINERNEIGETPLHLATKNNRLESVKMLVNLGADLNAQIDKVGHTPLHYSCMYGLTEASMILLEAGADAHMPDTTRLHRTPLETAKDGGYRPLFNLLLDAEMNLRTEREEKETLEEMSKMRGHEALMVKYNTLKKSNVTLNKDLKQRREDDKLMEEEITKRLSLGRTGGGRRR